MNNVTVEEIIDAGALRVLAEALTANPTNESICRSVSACARRLARNAAFAGEVATVLAVPLLGSLRKHADVDTLRELCDTLATLTADPRTRNMLLENGVVEELTDVIDGCIAQASVFSRFWWPNCVDCDSPMCLRARRRCLHASLSTVRSKTPVGSLQSRLRSTRMGFFVCPEWMLAPLLSLRKTLSSSETLRGSQELLSNVIELVSHACRLSPSAVVKLKEMVCMFRSWACIRSSGTLCCSAHGRRGHRGTCQARSKRADGGGWPQRLGIPL